MKPIMSFDTYFLNEAKKTVSKVEVKPGKMHKLLNIPADEKIQDHFKNGMELAKALVKALNGNQKKAAGMLAWSANIRKEHGIFDEALSALKKF
jgi:hypothetical protein